MSYFAELPAIMADGPELESEKLNALCTTSVNSALALTKPDVPVTVTLEYVPGGVPPWVATVSTTFVVPLLAGTVPGLNEQVVCIGNPEHDSVTGFGNVPDEGATLKLYVAACPAIIVCDPEPFAMEKPKPPITVTDKFWVSVEDPDAAA